MIITHNLQAMNTTRIVNANITAHAKSTSKISSGYKINRAADNPAGLAMSEAMRKQIRGLMQGINNTKDGVAFVQIADGAMDEIHAMLQRMNELSLKSLNGLCTTEDRAALNAEFDQLRTEIDRINDTTTFNTMPVFDKHEDSYYQICGNRQWKDNQFHTISDSENELNIHLPDGYEPKDYTLTVPAGTYTTQELIDEIDSALSKMDPPNPGFVFEYTSDGYCNLNFESAEGKPTNIAMVDGSLSYLIYDFQPGGSPASLLGTSIFGFNENGKPLNLDIVRDKNDELLFYAESAEGSKLIGPVIIPPGPYTRDQMIDELNKQLGKFPDANGIVAKPYGDFYIQITGGDSVNITGFKGNMFKCEPKGTYPYTSVFYDNVIYGAATKDNANITGYEQTQKIKIYGNSTNQNNILRFRVNGDPDGQFREITLPTGEYTVSEFVAKIKEILNKEENKELAAEIDITSIGSRLQLFSKKSGTQSKLLFDTSDPVCANAYKTLFCCISGTPEEQEKQIASVKGNASFGPSEQIKLSNQETLTIKVDGQEYPIPSNIVGGTHTNLQSLVNKLNGYVGTKPDLKDKVIFDINKEDNTLVLQSLPNADVDRISVVNKGAYTTLFTKPTEVPKGTLTTSSVTITGTQGADGKYEVVPESISITASPCDLPVTIDKSNNQISLRLYNQNTHTTQSITFKLDPGTYNDLNTLVRSINGKLYDLGSDYGNHIRADYSEDVLKFTLTPPKDNASALKIPVGKWDFSFSYDNPLLSAIMGTKIVDSPPDVQYGQRAKVTSRYPIIGNIELSDQCTNNELQLKVDNVTYTLKVNGIFNSASAIRDALQKAIEKSPLNGIVSATLNSSGKLVLTPINPAVKKLEASGSFCTEVLCKGLYSNANSIKSQGTSSSYPTCIIGRKDLTKEPIEITAGLNDTLTFDFTYPKDGKNVTTSINVTIPEKTYQNGYELVNVLNKAFKEQLAQDDLFGVNGDFDLTFSIGGEQTNVANNIDQLALQMKVVAKPGKEPDTGQYIIDGVRGNASCYVFYKTASLPSVSYIVGTKDIREGITFEPGKNVLTLSANSIPYQYTFEENKYYTADEFIAELNKRFEKGDDNGNSAPLRATLENGTVKIWHKTVGANTITDIGGGARGTIFFEEEGRDSRNPLILQVGAEQRSTIELPRIRVDSSSLSINSITISQAKYAEKAVEHIKDAIKALSDRRSTYGAMQNRLEHTVNNNENVTEQIQASDSRIRDNDMSSELIRYSNLNILLQAGHKMITHSNNNIKKLLTILE